MPHLKNSKENEAKLMSENVKDTEQLIPLDLNSTSQDEGIISLDQQ